MNSTTYGVDEYGNEAEDIRSGYVGEFKKFGFSGVPKHCLACDGSEISRATYSELFEVFGETYGAGDGETTFNLPDFRGAFLRSVGGNAAELGVEQGDAIRNITGKVEGIVVQGGSGGSPSALQSTPSPGSSTASPQPDDAANFYAVIELNADDAVPTAVENRPINYAVNVCVVYE